MLGIFSERFAVLMSFFFIRDIISLNVNLFFKRDDNFKDLPPITGVANYSKTIYNLSRIECASNSLYCAGFLYNNGTGTCHLLKTLPNDTTLNTSRWDSGLELYKNAIVCNPGWHLYKTHCYKYMELEAPWIIAKDYCANASGYLVRIESIEENVWIKETFLPTLYDNETCQESASATWIGASVIVQDEIFKWTNDERLVYKNWNPSEPVYIDDVINCVSMCRNGRWNNNNCTETFNLICERNNF